MNALLLANHQAPQGASAGAAWVERFLLPQLTRRFPTPHALSCLQVAPDDSSEAEKLRQLGYGCDMIEPTAALGLPVPDSSYDFAFSGHFSLRAPDRAARIALAREFHRVLRGRGAALLALGNRLCPLDLTRNDSLLHGPWARHCLTLREARDLLTGPAGFKRVAPLSVYGHFGWGRLPPVARPLGNFLDLYWRLVAIPSRRWLYASPLNPTLLLWLDKN